MTFVADDAALATGGRRLFTDGIGCGQQLSKPATESGGLNSVRDDDSV
ncbi:hypothetical protein [Streptomyces sp. NPDC088725]